MKKYFKHCLIAGVILVFLLTHYKSHGQGSLDGYSNHQQMEQRLKRLTQAHAGVARIQSLTKTAGGKDIWVITIGRGDTANRPGIAVVGGIAGDHLLGSELAVKFAEKILSNSIYTRNGGLLDSVTFYIFPDMSPDAREQFFLRPRYQRTGNAAPTDLDRDGRIGEDPYNDLNNDGLITRMRIKDPTGPWMKHPDDERVMVWARPEKGEKGEYLIYSEGLDEDNDQRFNEDGEEGVVFNRNFTYRYPVFTNGAGENAISENETRAIADFLYSATNIFAVVSLGEANNLTAPIKYSESSASARIPTGWQERDIKINEQISYIYQQHMDSLAPVVAGGSDGDFFQWAYFHYGRFSFSTQGWTLPAPEKNDEFQSMDLSLLRWAEKNSITDVIIPWAPVNHPGFPGRVVEVGGTVPFALKNPPYAWVDSIATHHTNFILSLAAIRPRIVINNIRTEKLSSNLHRITVDILNPGSFPTVSQNGEKVRWVKQTVLRTTAGNNQKIISGRSIDILGNINPHYSIERSWLIQGNGRVTLRAGSESTGFTEVQVNL